MHLHTLHNSTSTARHAPPPVSNGDSRASEGDNDKSSSLPSETLPSSGLGHFDARIGIKIHAYLTTLEESCPKPSLRFYHPEWISRQS